MTTPSSLGVALRCLRLIVLGLVAMAVITGFARPAERSAPVPTLVAGGAHWRLPAHRGSHLGNVPASAAGATVSAARVGGDDRSPNAPSNDQFANRIELTGNTVSATGSTVQATAETGEPDHYGNPAAHSVWWSWRATEFGKLTISTAGSNFDTVLGIYTGTTVSDLQFIAADDEGGGNSNSAITIFVTPGVAYAIAVDGYQGLTGSVSLQLSFVATSEIYSTNFDTTVGVETELSGFDGWLATNVSDRVSVTTTDPTYGRVGRIGYNPTQDEVVLAFRPINIDPVAAGAFLVQFTADVSIVDSTNGRRDNFYFVVYDMNGDPRAGINFDNTDLRVYRLDGNSYYDVGSFARGTRYPLTVTINFKTNRWSATLGTAVLFTEQPLANGGAPMTLGDIDPVWEITTAGSPGNNYMTFDNYKLTLLGTPLAVAAAPLNLSVNSGGSVYLNVAAEGAGMTYEWFRNGSLVSSSTEAGYAIANMAPGNAGSYTVTVSSAARSVTAGPFVVSSIATPDIGRLINLSVRTHAGSGAASLLMGLVIGGPGTAGTKPALVRVAGPTLTGFGVSGALADPRMDFIDQSSGQIARSNDNWSGDAQVTTVGTAVGAFPFASAASKDAAIVVSPSGGSYAVRILGDGGTSDIALAEVYDATPAAGYGAATPRLVNVSARAQVDTGDGILIAGFVIGGSSARTVLIRGVGPTLASYGVAGVLADPKLQLYRRVNGSDVLVTTSNDWGTGAHGGLLAGVASQVGAFALPAGSKDAAILITLPPGVYSAQLSGVNNTRGVGLVEVYEVQ